MPDRLTLVKGPPAARRSHLDGFVAALRPARAEARRRYGRALAQRNALLGRIRAGAAGRGLARRLGRGAGRGRGGADGRARRRGRGARAALRRRRRRARPRRRPSSLRAAQRGRRRPRSFAAELAERRESDLARGFTSHGPHLDEVAISLAGRALGATRRRASSGSALLALLFAERDALLRSAAEPPLMLLDDVTSRARPRAPRAALRAARGGRRADADHRDRELAPPGDLRAPGARGPRRRGDPRRRRRDEAA